MKVLENRRISGKMRRVPPDAKGLEFTDRLATWWPTERWKRRRRAVHGDSRPHPSDRGQTAYLHSEILRGRRMGPLRRLYVNGVFLRTIRQEAASAGNAV